MYLILTCSKDTYITDKIIANKFRVKDANVGRASTLDLFKLYDESILSGTDNPTELSRALLKFNYDTLQALTGSTLNINSSSFNCKLELFDIMSGHTNPTNFKLIVFPLAQSFDEGFGRDVISFDDLDSANFVTASYSSQNNLWYVSGANSQGLIGSSDIDIVSSGNLNDGTGVQNLWRSQLFVNGNENLSIDVTKIVSATMVGLLPDHGFRLSYSGTQETDAKTRFVKRFASRHVNNVQLRPRLVVSYDDTIIDNHSNFYFDLSGSLFLQNYHRGSAANILSGTALTPVGGVNCFVLTLSTGSYKKYITGSQHTGSATGIGIPGLYSASFAVPLVDSGNVNDSDTLTDFIVKSGSVTFDLFWSSIDRSVGYYTGSLNVNRIDRGAFDAAKRNYYVSVTNVQSEYKKSDIIKFKVFIEDINTRDASSKYSIRKESLIVNEMYYRIRDVNNGDIVVPYTQNNNGTRLSTDATGMYFEFHMNNLYHGRTYTIDFLLKDRGITYSYEDVGLSFRIIE